MRFSLRCGQDVRVGVGLQIIAWHHESGIGMQCIYGASIFQHGKLQAGIGLLRTCLAWGCTAIHDLPSKQFIAASHDASDHSVFDG